MSDKLLDVTANKLKNNPLLIAWFFVLLIGFFAALWLNYEDYLGSVRGYDSIGTQPITGITRSVVGLLPQVVQLILSLLILNAIGLRMRALVVYILLWLIFFGLDAYTDYLYLIGDSPTTNVKVWAFIQAVALYTIGSEWLFMVTFGLLFRITPTALTELAHFLTKMWDSIADIAGSMEDNKSNAPNRDIPTGMPKRETDMPDPRTQRPPKRR